MARKGTQDDAGWLAPLLTGLALAILSVAATKYGDGPALILSLVLCGVLVAVYVLFPKRWVTARRAVIGLLLCSVAGTNIIAIIRGQAPHSTVETIVVDNQGQPCQALDAILFTRHSDCVGTPGVTDDAGYVCFGGLDAELHHVLIYKVEGESVRTAEFAILANGRDRPVPQRIFPLRRSMAHDLGRVCFSEGSAVLNKEAHKTIVGVYQFLEDHDGRMLFSGNCSNTGGEAHNLALGAHRARAVRDALVRLGVPGDRLMMVSYGKSKLVDDGEDEAAGRRNRRVEFTPLPPNESYRNFLEAGGRETDPPAGVAVCPEPMRLLQALPLVSIGCYGGTCLTSPRAPTTTVWSLDLMR